MGRYVRRRAQPINMDADQAECHQLTYLVVQARQDLVRSTALSWQLLVRFMARFRLLLQGLANLGLCTAGQCMSVLERRSQVAGQLQYPYFLAAWSTRAQ